MEALLLLGKEEAEEHQRPDEAMLLRRIICGADEEEDDAAHADVVHRHRAKAERPPSRLKDMMCGMLPNRVL